MTEGKEYNIDPSWKGVVKWGGLSLFVAGVIVFILVLSALIAQLTLPTPAKETLENPTAPTAWYILAAFGELLLMPGVLALYFCLKGVKKTPAFIATALWLVCVPMFLASRSLIISVSQISGRYMAATSEAMKAAYLASAELAIETQGIFAYMALICLAVATIIIGWVMLKGAFSKWIGYLVIAAGILTFSTPAGVIMEVPIIIPFIGIVLGGVWQLIVGFKLYRMGRSV